MLLTTTENIPGRQYEILGVVKGNMVQTKNIARDIGQGLKSMVGGELTTYTEMMNESRAVATKRMVEEAERMGADAIVLKDMAGLIPPYVTAEIIRSLKKNVSIPVWFHTHDTAGLGASSILSAVDAGLDAADVSISPFANGTK